MADKPPYFPFYPKDFSADDAVEAMSTTAVGAYILLLCKAWHQEPPATLPDDDRLLARWSRLSLDEWSEVKPEVIAAFTLCGDGRWQQKRLRNEYAKYRETSRKNREAAKQRWAKEKGDANAMRTHSERNANAMPRASDSGSNSAPKDSSTEIPKILNTERFRAQWEAWKQHRRETRKKLTPTSASRQLKRLEKMGHDNAIAAIEHSIANGWQGIFEPDGKQARPGTDRRSRVEAPAGKYDGKGIDL